LHGAGPKSERIKKIKNKENTKTIPNTMSFAIGDVPIKLKATALVDKDAKQTMQTLVQFCMTMERRRKVKFLFLMVVTLKL
jgi:hypothetical protein